MSAHAPRACHAHDLPRSRQPIKHASQPCPQGQANTTHTHRPTSSRLFSSLRARSDLTSHRHRRTRVDLGQASRHHLRSCLSPQPEMEAAVGYVNGDADSLLMATELRLGLPGTDDKKPPKTTAASPPATPRGKKRTADAFEDSAAADEAHKADDVVEAAPPVAKAQVVGWPPVRSYRKSCFQAAASKSKATKKAEDASSNTTAPSAPAASTINGGSFVKVSMDGAPYLRKIDMRMYKGYRELREALEAMFVCFSGADSAASNPSEYAITYEDKDGDLMLVGDVPFDMFSGTCKKLRIIKRSEATGLGSK
ncbi:hypothetical protein ACQ4PT_016442 [Festuca glaucescens]